MTNYRRTKLSGGCYFFTVALADRHKALLVEHIDHLRHCIWTLSENDADYATRWNLIKGSFSRSIESGESHSNSRTKRGERGIWQRRFWEHVIRDAQDFNNHLAYIHINPVKHGHVKRAIDWPYSSIHQHIKRGLCDPSWAAEPFVFDLEFE